MAESHRNGNSTSNGSNKYQYKSLDDVTSDPTTTSTSDVSCGCGPCKPASLQRLAHPVLFTFHAGILLATHLCGLTYFNGILTTIERQFQLSSSEVGALTILNDVSSLSLILFVTYFGHRSHRPRWVASGAIIVSVGLLFCVLPHYLSDPIDPQSLIEGGSAAKGRTLGNGASRMSGICVRSLATSNSSQLYQQQQDLNVSIVDECEKESSNGIGPVKWLIIGQIIMGFGSAPLFPLTLSYIDDAVKKHKFTSYTAFLFIAITTGPIGGFFLTSAATARYVDFDRIPADQIPDLQQYDPRWIGAWWLGFPLFSVLLVVFAIPMFFYPKVMTVKEQTAENDEPLKGAEDEEKEEDSISMTMPKGGGIFKNTSGGLAGLVESLKGVILTLKRFFQNSTLMFLCLGASFETAQGAIQSTFHIKYLQTQFGTSPGTAALLMGGLMVPLVSIAQVVSAVICRRYKLNTKQCTKFVFICHIVGLVTVFGQMFVGCPNLTIAGINSQSPSQSMETAFTTSTLSDDVAWTPRPTGLSPPLTTSKSSPHQMQCNSECSCPDEIFRPVCGADHVSYISPCHAGCTQFNKTLMQYSGCSCVDAASTTTNSSDGNAITDDADTAASGLTDDDDDTAASGLCRDSCDTTKQLTIAMILGAVGVFCMSLTFNPLVFITFRVVAPDDRSVALGFKNLFTKCLGFFPAPILMGALINSTCILWQVTCGKQGSCWLYDLVAYRYLFMGSMVGLKILGVFCYGAVVKVVKPYKNEDEHDNDEEMSDLKKRKTPIN